MRGWKCYHIVCFVSYLQLHSGNCRKENAQFRKNSLVTFRTSILIFELVTHFIVA